MQIKMERMKLIIFGQSKRKFLESVHFVTEIKVKIMYFREYELDCNGVKNFLPR